MNFLAQHSGIVGTLERFMETLGVGHVFGAMAVVLITGVVLFFQRVDVAILAMLVLSVCTGLANEAAAGAAYIGRWYFLLLAAVVGMIRPGRAYAPITILASLWAIGNILSICYSSSIEEGAVRGLFFLAVIPALMLSMAPPNGGIDSLIRLIRWVAISGVAMAFVHCVFIAGAAPGRGVERYASAFASSQSMSISTATLTLPMIWVVVSRNAGKWSPVLFAGVLVNLAAMIASAQRTGLFSLALAVLIVLCFYPVRGSVFLLLGGPVVMSLLWPVITYLTSPAVLLQRFSTVESQDRTKMWFYFLERAMDRPIVGHGSGSASLVGEQTFGLSFHNAYLAIFYDVGIVGLFSFAALLVVGTVTALRLAKSNAPKCRAMGVFLLASFLQVAVQGISEIGLANTANHTSMLFYFALGMAAAAARMDSRVQRIQIMSDEGLPSRRYGGARLMTRTSRGSSGNAHGSR